MYSPLTLAYVGDAVYEIMVPVMLAKDGGLPAGLLHRRAKTYVAAAARAGPGQASSPSDRGRRGYFPAGPERQGPHPRQKHPGGRVQAATGLEALFGYLYLKGRSRGSARCFASSRTGGRRKPGAAAGNGTEAAPRAGRRKRRLCRVRSKPKDGPVTRRTGSLFSWEACASGCASIFS